jgi:hypothetical protein
MAQYAVANLLTLNQAMALWLLAVNVDRAAFNVQVHLYVILVTLPQIGFLTVLFVLVKIPTSKRELELLQLALIADKVVSSVQVHQYATLAILGQIGNHQLQVAACKVSYFVSWNRTCVLLVN